jgi:hypothetical protein
MICCFFEDRYQQCAKYVVKSRQIVRCMRKGTHNIPVTGTDAQKKLCSFHYEMYMNKLHLQSSKGNEKSGQKQVKRYSQLFLKPIPIESNHVFDLVISPKNTTNHRHSIDTTSSSSVRCSFDADYSCVRQSLDNHSLGTSHYSHSSDNQ